MSLASLLIFCRLVAPFLPSRHVTGRSKVSHRGSTTQCSTSGSSQLLNPGKKKTEFRLFYGGIGAQLYLFLTMTAP